MLKPLDLAKEAIKILDSKKAVDIKLLRVDKLTALTEYFVICNGTSTTQIKTLADEVEFKLKEMGETPHHNEGYKNANWILLDYGSVIVHILSSANRNYYGLENLWKESTEINIDDLLTK